MKKTLSIAALSLIVMSSQAQKLKFSEISLYGNSGSTSASPLTKTEMNYLSSNLNVPNLVNVSASRMPNESRYSNAIGISAGWNVASKKPRSYAQKLRLGFQLGSYGLNYNGYWNNSVSTVVDSLVSLTTGNKVYVDSVFAQNASISHNAQMFTMNACYIITLNAERRFSFHTGVGAGLGFSLHNTVQAYYSEYSYRGDYYNYNHLNSYSNNYKLQSDSKNLGLATNVRVYVPIGINFRLSNKSAFFRHINLFTEYNLGLEVNNMEGINSNIGMYNAMNSGVRISFNDKHENKKPRFRKNY